MVQDASTQLTAQLISPVDFQARGVQAFSEEIEDACFLPPTIYLPSLLRQVIIHAENKCEFSGAFFIPKDPKDKVKK